MTEEWRNIAGYEGLYQVSNLGRVKSLDREIVKSDGSVQKRVGRLKSQHLNRDGYYCVGLSNGGHKENVLVHKLVAETFVGGKFDGAEVNHKDFNRRNNAVDNLEWISHLDNIKYSAIYGSRKDISGENNPNYGNHVLRERYRQDKDYALSKQSRRRGENGRSVAIVAIFKDNTNISFDSMADCAEYLINKKLCRSSNVNNVVVSISKSLKSNKEYFGVRFKYR